MKHVVMFRIKEGTEPVEKARAMGEFKRDIEALAAEMACVKSMEVGFNANPSEPWDMVLIGEFDTMADVHLYGGDPRHVAIVQRIKPLLQGRACVDY